MAENTSEESMLDDVIAKLIIGTEKDCDVLIDKIMELVEDSDTIQFMLQSGKWKSIARKLGISFTVTERWNKEITCGQCTHSDVFGRTIMEWSSNNGKDATLGILMKTLETCRMKSFSDKLKEIATQEMVSGTGKRSES